MSAVISMRDREPQEAPESHGEPRRQEISVKAHAIHGVALCAAKKDVRYYLMGVQVECIAGERITLVASDGQIMCAYILDSIADTTISGVLPLDVIKKIPKQGQITIEMNEPMKGRVHFDIHTATTKISTFAVDGTFPSWIRMYPERVERDEVEIAHYDPELLARLTRSALTATDQGSGTYPAFLPRGDSVGVMTLSSSADLNDWVGVISPVRVASTPDRILEANKTLACVHR